MVNTSKILSFIVVFIAGGFAGFALGSVFDGAETENSVDDNGFHVPVNWRQYESSQYGVALAYPPEWDLRVEDVDEGPAEERVVLARGAYTLTMSLAQPPRDFGGGLAQAEDVRDLVSIRQIGGYSLMREPEPVEGEIPGDELFMNPHFYYEYGEDGYEYGFTELQYAGTSLDIQYAIDRDELETAGLNMERVQTMDQITRSLRFLK